MKTHKVDILAIQELWDKQSKTEQRRNYTWYTSGHVKTHDRSTDATGVGFVIHNKLKYYVKDIEPVCDRMMRLSLHGAPDLHLISAYAPPANYSAVEAEQLQIDEEKDNFYSYLQTLYEKCKAHGVTMIMGDFNARIHKRQSTTENSIGPYTFDKRRQRTVPPTESVEDNRRRLLAFTTSNQLMVANTWFQKPEHKLATYRDIATPWGDPEYKWPKYEQLDYIILPQRWRNSILDIESDVNSNISTDHFPVWSTVRTKLKEVKPAIKVRKKYSPCTKGQAQEYNGKIRDTLPHGIFTYEDIKSLHRAAEGTIPLIQHAPKGNPETQHTRELMGRRQTELEGRRRPEVIKNLTKQIQKSRRKDRNELQLTQTEGGLDVRNRYMGLKYMYKQYQPRPYSRQF